MIVDAARRFGCAHEYVVTAADDDLWLFVCAGCGHRTEQLPLTREASFGQVLAFPSWSVGAAFGAGSGASGRDPHSPLIQSA